MDIKTIQPVVKRYIDSVAKRVKVQAAYLYGSVVQGQSTDESDVDVLILSEDFGALNPDDRSKMLYRASVGFPYDLHVYGVTPSEFASASRLSTLGQIREASRVLV